jgi:hypothetical protein
MNESKRFKGRPGMASRRIKFNKTTVFSEVQIKAAVKGEHLWGRQRIKNADLVSAAFIIT